MKTDQGRQQTGPKKREGRGGDNLSLPCLARGRTGHTRGKKCSWPEKNPTALSCRPLSLCNNDSSLSETANGRGEFLCEWHGSPPVAAVKRGHDDGRWEMRQPLSLRNAALLLLREGRRGEERCPRGPIGHGGGELPLLVYITAERARQRRRGRRSSRYARGARALPLPARRRGAW